MTDDPSGAVATVMHSRAAAEVELRWRRWARLVLTIALLFVLAVLYTALQVAQPLPPALCDATCCFDGDCASFRWCLVLIRAQRVFVLLVVGVCIAWLAVAALGWRWPLVGTVMCPATATCGFLLALLLLVWFARAECRRDDGASSSSLLALVVDASPMDAVVILAYLIAAALASWAALSPRAR